MILDYLRHYGEDSIGGVNFVGGVTKLGGDEATSVLTADFLSLIPGFFSWMRRRACEVSAHCCACVLPANSHPRSGT